jgi:hypothetical protein
MEDIKYTILQRVCTFENFCHSILFRIRIHPGSDDNIPDPLMLKVPDPEQDPQHCIKRTNLIGENFL